MTQHAIEIFISCLDFLPFQWCSFLKNLICENDFNAFLRLLSFPFLPKYLCYLILYVIFKLNCRSSLGDCNKKYLGKYNLKDCKIKLFIHCYHEKKIAVIEGHRMFICTIHIFLWENHFVYNGRKLFQSLLKSSFTYAKVHKRLSFTKYKVWLLFLIIMHYWISSKLLAVIFVFFKNCLCG